MPLYDFRCPIGHWSELVRTIDTESVCCPECGEPAIRQHGAHRVSHQEPEADTRGMFRRYREATQEMDHAYSKVEASTGQPVQAPDLWGIAKQRAKAMIAAGEG
jgi:putative FmdB family regulatory protein